MAKNFLSALLLILAATAPIFSQNTAPATAQPSLSVNLDFFNTPDDVNFLKQEIRFINYIRDPALADVQVQQTTMPVGNGATRQALFFFGKNRFAGQNDTVAYVVQPAENQGIAREKLLRAFRRGLLGYLLRTAAAEQIEFTLNDAPDNAHMADAWNLWTFDVDLFGHFSSSGSSNDNGSLGIWSRNDQSGNAQLGGNVARVGERWKFFGHLGYSAIFNHQERVNYPTNFGPETYSIDDTWHLIAASTSAAYALSQHISVGAGAGLSHLVPAATSFSSESDYRYDVDLEYSFFPYRDYFRRQFVVGYQLNWQSDGNSLFTASPFEHQVYVNYGRIAPWGLFGLGLDLAHRYEDALSSRWQMSASAALGINLAPSVYLTVRGGYQLNQTNYPAANLNGSEPLQGKLNSDHLDTVVGLYYYFGNGFQNVLNPRLYQSNIAL